MRSYPMGEVEMTEKRGKWGLEHETPSWEITLAVEI